MHSFRCPTCLTLLEGGEARCPACRSRLRKRGQPIVLGEKSRISARPLLAIDREFADHTEALHAEERRRRRVADAAHRSSATAPSKRRPTTEPAIMVEAELVWLPDPEPVFTFIDLTTEPDIDLTDDAGPEPVVEFVAPPTTRLAEDMHELIESLHRKARAEEPQTAIPDPIPAAKPAAKPAASRALRLLSSRRQHRPAWSVDFRVGPSETSDS